MSFTETTAPEQAVGEVAALYSRLGGRDYLPNYARVFSHRPALIKPISVLQEVIKDRLEPRLWALVTLAAARAVNSSYCSLVFANRLVRHWLTEEELIATLESGDRSTDWANSDCAAARGAARSASSITVSAVLTPLDRTQYIDSPPRAPDSTPRGERHRPPPASPRHRPAPHVADDV